jgi:hypothetical protein
MLKPCRVCARRGGGGGISFIRPIGRCVPDDEGAATKAFCAGGFAKNSCFAPSG